MTIGSAILTSALAGVVLCLVIYQLSKIYQQTFLVELDQGLQDILLYMDPRQLVNALLLFLVILIPISLYLFNIPFTILLAGGLIISPKIILPFLRKKRHARISEQLPDTLASMSSAMRSGLNLVQALQQIVKNQPPPISQEFAQVLLEYRVGQDLEDSMDAFHKRVPTDELLLINSAIKISRKVGGNLSETFEILAETIREKMKIEGRINALTAMGKAQGWVAVIFPLLMGYAFYKIEPVAISMLFTTLGGWIWLVLMLLMITIASILIRKIVDIDV